VRGSGQRGAYPDSIDVGIDLGTTNSAIAVVEDGTVSVVKNNDGWDSTPSAIWLPKPDTIHVGRRARSRVGFDPDNAAAEFKQEMGLADARKEFVSAGRPLTPQELSAEVLKSLRADAAHHCGAAPESAVITVPAAFTLNENKATTEAAELAGFGPSCPLVQEPTAAAFAYGFHDSSDRGYWMVFDFGGGMGYLARGGDGSLTAFTLATADQAQGPFPDAARNRTVTLLVVPK
jgi:molecular chaperone DnaK